MYTQAAPQQPHAVSDRKSGVKAVEKCEESMEKKPGICGQGWFPAVGHHIGLKNNLLPPSKKSDSAPTDI